jgi:hypothetical protein
MINFGIGTVTFEVPGWGGWLENPGFKHPESPEYELIISFFMGIQTSNIRKIHCYIYYTILQDRD